MISLPKFRSLALAVSFAAVAALVSGCGSSSTTTPPVNPTITLVPASVAVGAGQTAQFTPTTTLSSSQLVWQVDGITGGNSTVGTISTSGLYTAPAGAAPQVASINVVDSASETVSATAQAYVVSGSSVSTTANGQVASYSINLPGPGTVSVEFGTTTSYGRSTWQVASPTAGGTTTVLVAGMLANTAYHMRADVSLANGLSYTDADRQFTTTQSVPNGAAPTVGVQTAAGQTPQPGVELLTNLGLGAFFYDLQGNMLWGYNAIDDSSSDQVQPAKLLSNGHVLIQFGPGSNYPVVGPTPVAGTIWEIREVDLANNTIRSLTMDHLQLMLNETSYLNDQGSKPTLLAIHHDVMVNPTNGHWIVLANSVETESNLTGYSSPVNVLGDILLDVDPNNNFAVDWIWNEFDHLDVNRHPYSFPDWTHTNAVVYSPDDHNILVSIRHQNWVLKVNYQDGTGNGNIVWHLGYQGDFTLQGGTDPQDWMYAQHEPSFTTSNTTGVFGLTLMDNGDDRVFPSGYTCGAPGNLPCLYSRAPIFTIDETNMTATLSNPAIGPVYNFFGGNAEVLANGDSEADYCGGPAGSVVYESTVGPNPTPVWTMTTGGYEYRAHRLPSMYPGVQW